MVDWTEIVYNWVTKLKLGVYIVTGGKVYFPTFPPAQLSYKFFFNILFAKRYYYKTIPLKILLLLLLTSNFRKVL